MPDIHIDPIYLVILLVFGAGLALGWVAHAITTPTAAPVRRSPALPHVVMPPLKTKVYEKPAAPPKPLWEEDPFFARPEDLGKSDKGDIEHIAGVVAFNPRPGVRAIG